MTNRIYGDMGKEQNVSAESLERNMLGRIQIFDDDRKRDEILNLLEGAVILLGLLQAPTRAERLIRSQLVRFLP
jgi:hypothetical protein